MNRKSFLKGLFGLAIAPKLISEINWEAAAKVAVNKYGNGNCTLSPYSLKKQLIYAINKHCDKRRYKDWI